MPTALWIAHVSVTDPVAYGEYAKRATVAIAKTPAAHTGAFFTKCNEGDITDSVVVRYAGGASVSERAQPVSPPRPHPEPRAEAAAATP